MSVAAPPQIDAFRRVFRLRSLNCVSYIVERKFDRHDPVMVDEVIGLLELEPGAVVVDGTVGLGGHSQRFLELMAPEGVLLAFDWDEAMLQIAKQRLVALGHTRLLYFNKDCREIASTLDELNLKADAIFLDLGLNSAQLDDPKRGLSFLREGPLDMRMDRSRGEPASAVLNRLSPQAIESMLREYGDERWARAISRAIVDRRKSRPLRTTMDLAECVLETIPKAAQDKRIHPATRTFQAVRIYVNGELEGLEEAMVDAARRLATGGVMAVLSYHSGEDRAAKRAFRELAAEGFQELTKKPIEAGEAEAARNPRSRSAKLRAIRRIAF